MEVMKVRHNEIGYIDMGLTTKGIGIVIKSGANVSLPEVDARVGISYAADACLTCGKKS